MKTTSTIHTRRFHTSLNVTDLTRSVQFYRVLLGLEPSKHLKDYAKFDVDDPPLVLSLLPGRPIPGGALNHVGLRLPDSEALVQVQMRLEADGIRTQREEGVECCQSRQTKFWVNDPDQTLWEIYVLHESVEEDEQGHAPTADRPNAFANDSAPAARHAWQHNLSEGPIDSVPHENNSLHEILLEGSANLHPGRFNLMQLLKDAHRALRPGGEVRIHGLTADTSLKDPFPSLPGPAVAVQHVPAHAAIARALHTVGFSSIRFERLSEKAHFTRDDVGLREFLLAARKPGHRPQVRKHAAVYLGPLASVTDDFGNIFLRGEAMPLNIHDWQALKNGCAGAQFLFLALAPAANQATMEPPAAPAGE